jgi:spermidine synthase
MGRCVTEPLSDRRPGVASESIAFAASLAAASGMAALVFEIVWFQQLELAIGSSAVSLGVIVATFMGGMCLGSLLLARCVGPHRHPLLTFAALELGIACCGVALLAAAPAVGSLYHRLGPAGPWGYVARATVAAVCLLPPTILMGATLPTLARWAGGRSRRNAVGWLQAANLAGGVLGCLLAGFVLLPRFDLRIATVFAALMNLAAAVAALTFGRRVAHQPPRTAAAPGSPTRPAVVFAIALSGLAALGAEVIWTRLLALQVGGTAYAFTLILAVFLAGLGIGNAVGAAVADAWRDAAAALGWCQLLAVAAIAWAAHQIAVFLPHWPIDPTLATRPFVMFQVDLIRCAWAIMPAAVVWGASFPLALAAAVGLDADAARPVGRLAAANTAGAVVGAIGGGVLLVWWLGSQRAQQVLMTISCLAALPLIVPGAAARGGRGFGRLLAAAATVAAAAFAIATVPATPGLLVGCGRHSALLDGRHEFVFVGEGLQADVAVSRGISGRLYYHNAGKVQASSEPQDMRLQRLLGHLTTLVHDAPRSVLVIGCGAGVTAGAVALDPRVAAETIVEIEPLVPQAARTHFGDHNHRVLEDPRVTVVIDDARHYLLTTDSSFDAITSDPLDPWVKGAAALFTVEFLEVVKSRLAADGVFTMFVQLYATNEDAVKSQMASFFRVFPDGLVFANTSFGRGYDLVLLGRAGPTVIDVDAVQDRLASPGLAAVGRSLREVGIGSATQLLATFAGGADDLAVWLRDAALNRDASLRLQYLAGAGLHLQRGQEIYDALQDHPFRFPDAAFRGAPGSLEALREALLDARGER